MSQMDRISEIVKPIVESKDLLTYNIEWINENGMRILQISIMRKDGTMDIDTCALVSEEVSAKFDEDDFISGEYYLEVCSPGAERELRDLDEVKAAVGDYIYAKLKNPSKGIDDITGTLKSFEDNTLLVEYMEKAAKRKMEIDYDNVSMIRLAVKM